MEDARGSGDFAEKARNRFPGRALALIGIGTQFVRCNFDEERIMDTPQAKRVPRIRAKRDPAPASARTRTARESTRSITPRAPRTWQRPERPLQRKKTSSRQRRLGTPSQGGGAIPKEQAHEEG